MAEDLELEQPSKTRLDIPAAPGDLLDLSKQQRNLLLLRPLFQLELNKHQFGEAEESVLQGVDTHYLALNTLDYLMEGTTVGFGRRPEEVLLHLAAVLGQMKPALSIRQRERVAEIVLSALDNKMRQFSFAFYDAKRREAQTVKFRLVTYEPDLEDIYRYKPTPDGYLVYLGMLDLSPEDSQEMMEKMLQLLMDRGRFSDALEIARRARTHSIEYRQRIRDRLHQAYRAPGTVRWSAEMTPYLDEARAHVRRRQSEDQRMIDSVKEGLLAVEDLKTRETMVKLRETVLDSSTLRTRLLSDITESTEKYLRAQGAVFHARRPSGLPDLDTSLFPAVLGISTLKLATLADDEISMFYASRWPKLYDLDTVFGMLLERRHQEAAPDSDAGDIVPHPELPIPFSEHTIELVRDWLATTLGGAQELTLEEVLLAAQREGRDETFGRCVFLMLLRSYAPTESPFPTIRVTAEGRFRLALAEGSNLRFTDTDASPRG